MQLSTSRPVGQMGGVGAVPVSEVLAWAELHGVEGVDERRLLLRAVQAMDAAWLSHMKEDCDGNAKSRY